MWPSSKARPTCRPPLKRPTTPPRRPLKWPKGVCKGGTGVGKGDKGVGKGDKGSGTGTTASDKGSDKGVGGKIDRGGKGGKIDRVAEVLKGTTASTGQQGCHRQQGPAGASTGGTDEPHWQRMARIMANSRGAGDPTLLFRGQMKRPCGGRVGHDTGYTCALSSAVAGRGSVGGTSAQLQLI